MTGSGVFPKVDGDVLYADDINSYIYSQPVRSLTGSVVFSTSGLFSLATAGSVEVPNTNFLDIPGMVLPNLDTSMYHCFDCSYYIKVSDATNGHQSRLRISGTTVSGTNLVTPSFNSVDGAYTLRHSYLDIGSMRISGIISLVHQSANHETAAGDFTYISGNIVYGNRIKTRVGYYHE